MESDEYQIKVCLISQQQEVVCFSTWFITSKTYVMLNVGLLFLNFVSYLCK